MSCKKKKNNNQNQEKTLLVKTVEKEATSPKNLQDNKKCM